MNALCKVKAVVKVCMNKDLNMMMMILLVWQPIGWISLQTIQYYGCICIFIQIGSGRVTGSPGQLLPGRVGSRVNSFDPIPPLRQTTAVFG